VTGTPDQRREWRRNARARKIERYMVLHGESPLCKCGCGGNVRFDREGNPRIYIDHHQPFNTKRADEVRLAGNIPIEKVRAALNTLREQKGWQVREMADLAGIQWGQMNDLLYSKRRKTVGVEWTTMIMRRLAGLSSTPTPGQQRRIDRSIYLEAQAFKNDEFV
jgi:hypothetical protein